MIAFRWFDKTFSLIVAGDGVAGVNFEHSWGDGVAVLRYFNDIYNETTTKPFVTPDSVGNEQDVDTIVNKLGTHMYMYIYNIYVNKTLKYKSEIPN